MDGSEQAHANASGMGKANASGAGLAIASGDENTAHYFLAVALILSAVLLSAAVYFSMSSLSSSIAAIKFGTAAGAAPSAGIIAAAPAQQGAQGQQQAAAAPQQQAAAGAAIINLAGLPFKGTADAKVAIVEYSDFQCPFCARAYPTVKQVLKDYDGKVKFYYKHFPLGFHQNAQKAAEAYECALDQGKQWEYHDKLFDNSQGDGTGLNIADLKKYAADLGLDTAKFNSCLDGGQKAAKVQADTAEGAANGVSGTPTFFINGQAVVGAQPYSAFQQAIDAKLAG